MAALYEQKKVAHWGVFPRLEDQLCEYTADDTTEESPDRLDALVWGLTELLLTGRSVPYVAVPGATAPDVRLETLNADLQVNRVAAARHG